MIACCLNQTAKRKDVYLISPEKQKSLQKFGVNPDRVASQCLEFKDKYPDTILNPQYLSEDILLSTTTQYFLDRNQQNNLQRKGLIVTVFPKDFILEEIPETPEERKQRKAQQKLDFQKLEAKRGVLPKSLQETIKPKNGSWIGKIRATC